MTYLAKVGKVPIPQLRMHRLCHTMTPDRTRKNPHIATPSPRSLNIGRNCRLAAVSERPGGDDVDVFEDFPMALSVSTVLVEKYILSCRS